MSKRIFGFLMLLLYVNAIAYHETIIFDKFDNNLNSGITLVNVLLDDVFDIPLKAEQEVSDFQYDEYRVANQVNAILPILLLVFYLPRILKSDKLRTLVPKRLNKAIPLQLGYYQYLSRLKPF
ncbi:hypothetical protein [Sphingobacterium sp. SYP-B4668]|uniref:hypothetical protein n=1 Tax=Sphingobacterium sp. SYP-B4668 TaxID=2996035 RepID=UPI00053254A5|nr:hypothetical protein [Sphingobacterium sp. SYP-B4668]